MMVLKIVIISTLILSAGVYSQRAKQYARIKKLDERFARNRAALGDMVSEEQCLRDMVINTTIIDAMLRWPPMFQDRNTEVIARVTSLARELTIIGAKRKPELNYAFADDESDGYVLVVWIDFVDDGKAYFMGEDRKIMTYWSGMKVNNLDHARFSQRMELPL